MQQKRYLQINMQKCSECGIYYYNKLKPKNSICELCELKKKMESIEEKEI